MAEVALPAQLDGVRELGREVDRCPKDVETLYFGALRSECVRGLVKYKEYWWRACRHHHRNVESLHFQFHCCVFNMDGQGQD